MERFALVTGTTRGIGYAVVAELIARGWRVVGLARGEAPPGFAGTTYAHLVHDLADVAGLEALLAPLAQPGGPLATASRVALVNNAAQIGCEPTHLLSADALARALIVGAAAPAWLMGWAVRAAAARPLRIVNLSSGAASTAYAGWSAYCQSKAALDMASAVLGTELSQLGELAGRDVAVVSYAPGVVDTAMQAAVREADPRTFPDVGRFLELHTEGRLAPPRRPAREIADLVESDALPPFSRRRLAQ